MGKLLKCGVMVVSVAVVLAIMAVPAYAVRVAWNVDIHQGKWADFADEFTVWGQLESMNSPPTLTNAISIEVAPPAWAPVPPGGLARMDVFTPFITDNPALIPPAYPLPPGRPPVVSGGPFYYFKGDWKTMQKPAIPYCTWVHFGLEFDENGCNYGLWLRGMWLRNGVDPDGPPIYGFGVTEDAQGHTFIRIQNTSGVTTVPDDMDLMVLNHDEGQAFPLDHLNADFFNNSPEWNQRWKHVPTNLVPPVLQSQTDQQGRITVSSFFDVFLKDVPGLLTTGSVLPPGSVLLARQHSTFMESNPVSGPPTAGPQDFWQFELHGQPDQPVRLKGDINNDEFVNLADLQMLIAAWGSHVPVPPYNPNADLNNDGFINLADLQVLIANWGKSSRW